MDTNIIHTGRAEEVLKSFPDNCIDTVITDPPYGLSNHSEKLIRDVMGKWLSGQEDYVPDIKGFMSKSWDAFVPPPAVWREVYRVMKPGGTILCFAGSRTQDLMAMSLRLAGFEIKDTILWLYGQGFSKNRNFPKYDLPSELKDKWNGYGTHGLKPSYEPIILAIKPNEGSYADNALHWNVAGLNIELGRLQTVGRKTGTKNPNAQKGSGNCYLGSDGKKQIEYDLQNKGRFPANVILDEEAAQMLDKQSGISKSGKVGFKNVGWRHSGNKKEQMTELSYQQVYNDKGGVSRFFYCAKASKSERNAGLENMPKVRAGGMQGRNDGSFDGKITYNQNFHPTVKPLALLEYLVKLTAMPNENQIYLDPFIGSGTTAVACTRLGKKWIGIEVNPEYVEIAKRRIQKTARQYHLF
jgi:site-specific DNA-methyltransferase (adenine-specific)